MGEQWKDIPGLVGYYQVSDLGRVRSLERYIERKDGSRQIYRGVILRAQPAGGPSRPYLHVSLRVQGERIGVFVHQLVALAFLGEPPPGHHVHHINGDTKDNRLVNLKYVDAKEHYTHHRTGERNSAAVLCEADVAAIKWALAQGVPAKALARHYSVSDGTIYNIRNGRNWRHVAPATTLPTAQCGNAQLPLPIEY